MITIIGSGRVGTAAALYITYEELDDVLLLDIIPGRPQGEALDLSHALSILGKNVRVYGSNDFKDMSGSDIVLVTAGFPRGPGMTREQLVEKNAEVVRDIAKKVAEYAPKAPVIITTNPLDSMVYVFYKASKFPRNQVMGFSGVLDSGRMRYYIASRLGVAPSSVEAVVIGQHGEKMLPLPRLSSVAGNPLRRFLGESEIQQVVNDTIKAGAKIIELRGYSSSYAPGAGLMLMAKAIKRDEKRIFLTSVCLEGEYGLRDICVNVPAVLGRGGVEKVIELELTPEERKLFEESVKAIRDNIAQVPSKYFE
ncbi:MAG: malate dehydrogenase [Sulfolobales archaeon]